MTHIGGWKSDVKMTARIRVGKHYMEPRQERVLLPAHLHGKHYIRAAGMNAIEITRLQTSTLLWKLTSGISTQRTLQTSAPHTPGSHTPLNI